MVAFAEGVHVAESAHEFSFLITGNLDDRPVVIRIDRQKKKR